MISFANVRKSFGAKVVLRDVSFEVNAGEILFVLGRSGTGKSVLLKSIVGLLRPDHGVVTVDGREVTGLREDQMADVRRDCGMVFQHPALFDSLSVFENVAYGLRRHHADWSAERVRTRVTTCLGWVQMDHAIDQRPGDLSFGMQKRVSLARTLALAPRALLFDEPTTGLDPIVTNTINALIRTLSKQLNTTSIVVSHDMPCALAIADRILVLDDGAIIAEGTPADLKRSRHPLVVDFLKEVSGAEDY